MAQAGRRSQKVNDGDRRQLRLNWISFEDYPNAVCCHGTFIFDVCDRCLAETEASIAVYEAGVAAGKWDRQGYTPAERRAQDRRKQS